MTPSPSPPSIPHTIDGCDPTTIQPSLSSIPDNSTRDLPITSSPLIEPFSTQASSPTHDTNPTPPPPQPVPMHPMITRLKDGIVKPKHHSYLTTKNPIVEAFIALLPSHEKMEPLFKRLNIPIGVLLCKMSSMHLCPKGLGPLSLVILP